MTKATTKKQGSSKIANQHTINGLNKPKIYVPVKNSDARKYY